MGITLALLFFLPRAAVGQEELVRRCDASSAGAQAQEFCRLIAQAVEIAQPRIGLAASGGNPVPGTASTLGMRIGSMPRLSGSGRVTAVLVDLPPIQRAGAGDGITVPATTLNVDGTVGLFSGFSPAPTVGGVASVDLLGSAGILLVPAGDGFRSQQPFTWAIGTRVGLLRESFLTPGASVSAMYRRIGDTSYGNIQLQSDQDAYFAADLSALSLRAAVSKRFFLLGATAGLGWDRYSSDVVFRAQAGGARTDVLHVEDLENTRVSAFGNLSYTLLILSIVAELGWQSGGDTVEGLPGYADVDGSAGALFGGLALRLSI